MGVMDTMMSGGAPSFALNKVGDYVVGVVVDISERQDSVYEDSTQLKWWNRKPGPATGAKEDRPVMIPIFTLQIEKGTSEGKRYEDGGEDGGQGAVWARSNAFTAIRTAIAKAFPGRKPTDADVMGGTLKLRHHALGEAKPKMHPPKLFQAEFVPRSIVASSQADEQNPPPPEEW